MNDRMRRPFVIAVALVGAFLNGYYGYVLLGVFLAPQTDVATRQILVSAITLNFGWMALLIWVALKPFERRALLLFAGATILAANLLNSYSQLVLHPGDVQPLLLNMAIGVGFFALFLVAFLLAKPYPHREPSKSL